MNCVKTKTLTIILGVWIGLSMAAGLATAAYDAQVYQVQKALKARGYNPGPADGLWGQGTKRALEQFQRDSGLSVTGRLDAATLGKLGLQSRDRAYDRAIRRKQAPADKRVALVIGNAAYDTSPLRNPANDARDMAAALRALDFAVIEKIDAGRREMVKAVDEFYNQLRRADVGVFYYAGHGMQIRGANYLIPVDAHVTTETDVPFEAVDAGRVLGKMKSAGNKLNIVILDACRNNPFARSFRAQQSGLAQMDAPKGTLIAYATAPGSVAADGADRNGIFTKHLLANIKRSNLSVQEVFMETGLLVMRETRDLQIPWVSSTPISRYTLASSGAAVDTPTPMPAPVQETGGAYLSVESNVAGAAVYVDGRRIGITPISDVSIFPGMHRIRVEKQGYDAYERKVQVGKGRSASVYVDLSRAKPAAARLYVTTTPENARVRIFNFGASFHQGIKLEAGNYQLEVSAGGYETKAMWVALDAGEDKNLDIRLKKKTQGPKLGDTWTDPVTGMKFVWVPGGCFQMGSPSSEKGRSKDEGPVHKVCVDGFWMGKYEVTNAQYRQFKASHYLRGFEGKSLSGNTQPAVYVNWIEAKAFAKWLSRQNGNRFEFRLPTEAEWEYAARSGTTTARYWGNDPDDACGYANVHDQTSKRTKFDWSVHHNCDDGYAVTAPVGRYQPNQFGLYDMLGNVWEWCSDRYGAYSSGSVTNPVGPSSGSSRVIRGGCWMNSASYIRSADRNRYQLDYRGTNIGFRLARPVK